MGWFGRADRKKEPDDTARAASMWGLIDDLAGARLAQPVDGSEEGPRKPTAADWRRELARAIKMGDLSGVKTAVDHGAKLVSLRDASSNCPSALKMAIDQGKREVALWIIKSMDVESLAHTGEDCLTPLDLAALAKDEVLVRALGALGVDVEGKSSEGGLTSLMVAADNGVGAGVVEALLEMGADPMAEDADGNTAFMLAAAQGDCGTVEVLAAVSDRCRLDADGKTALMLAVGVDYSSIELVRAMIDERSAMMAGPEGMTALMLAVTEGDRCIEELTAAVLPYSDPWAIDEAGWTALELVLQTENLDQGPTVALLVDAMLSSRERSDMDKLASLSVAWGIALGARNEEASEQIFPRLEAFRERMDLMGASEIRLPQSVADGEGKLRL